MNPAVSVIVPNKNRSALLAVAIESLLAQTLPEWEAIIVDDGSEPENLEAIRQHAAVDSRLKLILRDSPPAGGNHCRNIGVAAASAPLLVFLDSDDALSPRCLEARVRVMAQNPELDFAVFPHMHFSSVPGDRDEVWQVESAEHPLDRFLRFSIPWQTAGPVWRKKSFEQLGGWDERLPSSQDWDLHVRALASGLQFQTFTEPIFFWRLGSDNRESVGVRAKGPTFIRGRELAYSKAADLLAARGLFNDHRRLLFARLFLILAESWSQLSEGDEAKRVWTECLSRRWIHEGQYRQGLRLLRLWPSRWKRGLYRRYLRLQWPAELRHDFAP
jgi:glycosyltransferase involved in cell wall biosynthesis